MDKAMDLPLILQLLQTGSVILAMVVAIGTVRNRSENKTAELTEMRVDIKYIKEKLDGHDKLREVLGEVKASEKAAHKRLDDHMKYDHNIKIDERRN